MPWGQVFDWTITGAVAAFTAAVFLGAIASVYTQRPLARGVVQFVAVSAVWVAAVVVVIAAITLLPG